MALPDANDTKQSSFPLVLKREVTNRSWRRQKDITKMSSSNDVAGRLVLITGASGGIGSACAKQFLDLGCHLALTYSSNRDSLAELIESFRQTASERKLQITIHQADLASPEQTIQLCEDVQKEHGRAVDILISNAGYGKRIRDVSEIPLSEFEITLNVNLRAPFLLVKGVVDGMKAQKWGRIIFVSSIAAYGGGMNVSRAWHLLMGPGC
jgi:3-oxoacyl-[acyl-carrier protein] reductase